MKGTLKNDKSTPIGSPYWTNANANTNGPNESITADVSNASNANASTVPTDGPCMAHSSYFSRNAEAFVYSTSETSYPNYDNQRLPIT